MDDLTIEELATLIRALENFTNDYYFISIPQDLEVLVKKIQREITLRKTGEYID